MKPPIFLQGDKSYQNITYNTKYQQIHAKKAVRNAQLLFIQQSLEFLTRYKFLNYLRLSFYV